MPIIGQPQIFQIGQGDVEAMQALGQGGGQLLGALINYYRQRGIPGLGGGGVDYTSPTGVSTQISPAERVAGQPNARLTDLLRVQATVTPGASATLSSLPFLPQPSPDLEGLKTQSEIALHQAKVQQAAGFARRVGALTPSGTPSPPEPLSPFGEGQTLSPEELEGLYELAADESDPDLQALALEMLQEAGEDL